MDWWVLVGDGGEKSGSSAYLPHDIVDFDSFAECFLKIGMFRYFAFGDVHKDVANLEDIVQVGFAVD
jgi:hypothetical protein